MYMYLYHIVHGISSLEISIGINSSFPCTCSIKTCSIPQTLIFSLYLSLSHLNIDPDPTTEFYIHSLDGKVWYFDASTPEEMSDWVKVIEGQIKKILEESLLPKRNVSF